MGVEVDFERNGQQSVKGVMPLTPLLDIVFMLLCRIHLRTLQYVFAGVKASVELSVCGREGKQEGKGA